MFGVIDFDTSFHNGHILLVYPDIGSAIAYFARIQSWLHDVGVIPHPNDNLELLKTQDLLYNVHNLETFHLPSDSIINLGIVRDKSLNCRLGSVLLKLTPEHILSLQEYYEVRYITYQDKQCSLCSSHFKIWDMYNNCGYYGSSYNPIYYTVLPLVNLEPCHILGCDHKLSKKLSKLEVEPEKIFCVKLDGGLHGLILATFPLPDEWNSETVICWSCMQAYEDKTITIWAH